MSTRNTRREISPFGATSGGASTSTSSRFGAARNATTLLVCVALLLSACSSKPTASGADPAARATTTTTLPPAEVTSTVADGATDVPLTAPIGVTVDHGTFDSVTLTRGPDATIAPEPAEGVLNAAQTGWLSPSDFAPNTPYRIDAEVSGVDGKASRHSWKFTTGAPATELHTTTNVGDGSVYGVGMPIIVTLNASVPEPLRKAVTDRLKVTSEPAVTGGWRWFTDTEVHYRPSAYWPAHTNVHLDVDFTGLHLGNGVWGVDGRTVDFSIGDA
ncbi:MAG TPA: Ig-like domain-containing protein, partial [Acidimicrobiales bacterium]|nr:Ig-like domain-containing protein [Acidimicrobiales bacterium]